MHRKPILGSPCPPYAAMKILSLLFCISWLSYVRPVFSYFVVVTVYKSFSSCFSTLKSYVKALPKSLHERCLKTCTTLKRHPKNPGPTVQTSIEMGHYYAIHEKRTWTNGADLGTLTCHTPSQISQPSIYTLGLGFRLYFVKSYI